MPDDRVKDLYNDRRILRIAFEGQSSYLPVVSSLTIQCETMINILGANTENIGGKAYGQMLIEIPKEADKEKRIKQYLDEHGLYYEEGGGVNG